jgi:hypothetical protein
LVAAAILAEFVLIIGHPLFGWGAKSYAATPRPLVYGAALPPSGDAVLLALSAAAARQPAPAPSGRTQYAYVRREWWRLAARRSGKPPPAKVLPTVTQSWTAPDGAGRILRITAHPGASRTEDATVAAGHPLPGLSTRPAVLVGRFGFGYPTSTPPAGEFVRFADLADSQPVPPAVEATILRLLARIPDVVNSGTVTDRAGRPGVAVSLQSDYTGTEILYTLIFATATGQILEADETLTGDPGALDVPQGSVIAYTTFLASSRVAGTTAPP